MKPAPPLGAAAVTNSTSTASKKLRELILELAVRGQLVPQNPNDEPAGVYCSEKIAAEKARLIKDGKLKKQEPLPPITDDEKPFELPEGWEWTYLENVGLVASSSRVHQKRWQDSGSSLFIVLVKS